MKRASLCWDIEILCPEKEGRVRLHGITYLNLLNAFTKINVYQNYEASDFTVFFKGFKFLSKSSAKVGHVGLSTSCDFNQTNGDFQQIFNQEF